MGFSFFKNIESDNKLPIIIATNFYLIYLKNIQTYIVLIVLLFAGVSAQARNYGDPTKPCDSVFGIIYLNDVWNIDSKNNACNVDFYLNLWCMQNVPCLKLITGDIISVDTVDSEMSNYSKGWQFVSLRIKASIRCDFNLEYFPVNVIDLKIILESEKTSNHLCLLTKEGFRSVVHKEINIPGMFVDSVTELSTVYTYKLPEYGVIKSYSFSRLVFSIPIKPLKPIGLFFKDFLPSLIAILIIFIGLFFEIAKIELRLSITIGSLFLCISNLIVTQQELPDTAAISLIEKINIASLLLIFLTTLSFTLSHYLCERFKSKHTLLAELLLIIVSAGLFSWYLYDQLNEAIHELNKFI